VRGGEGGEARAGFVVQGEGVGAEAVQHFHDLPHCTDEGTEMVSVDGRIQQTLRFAAQLFMNEAYRFQGEGARGRAVHHGLVYCFGTWKHTEERRCEFLAANIGWNASFDGAVALMKISCAHPSEHRLGIHR
jgi:hypothetical protein